MLFGVVGQQNVRESLVEARWKAPPKSAKFWHYDYGVDDVLPIIKKLESMGFAENGKLTEKGKAELNDNEYVYFYHRKSYAHLAFTLPEFCRAVNAQRDIPYRDLIWEKYNKLYMGAISSPKKCRDLRYSMYEFLVDEKKFETAFSMLLEIPFYDMNCQYPFIAPSIMQELKKAQKKAGFTEDQIFDMAKERYGRMLVENPTVPAIDVAGIVTSYIFGKDSREIFFKKNSEFKNYSIVIHALFDFALKDLFVIRSSHSGLISANFLLPMAFRIEKEKTGMKGDFAVPLMEPVILDIKKKDILNEIVDQINTVLYTIIPGMSIEIKDYGKQAMDSGEEGWKVELMSNREGKRTIPIRMESEGIIKIVSILNVLIQAFGNSSICLVIDELDAGIFEYMLGELLDIFNKSAKGQLIFTSHNLRALEMLDKDSIMFSTANPNNRYIHMKNVKGSNNLRSMYIRSITLGGQEEKIYEETDSLKIARAFRKAGRRLRSE